MRNEKYCNDIEIQILNCIRECPKSTQEIKQRLGTTENINAYIRRLKRLNLIVKVRTNSACRPIWSAKISLSEGADNGQ